MPKFIDFHPVVPARRIRTKIWMVTTKGGVNATALGFVKWFPRWRAYAFFPQRDTVYEKQCLRDLADFCERATIEHKSAIENRKSKIRK